MSDDHLIGWLCILRLQHQAERVLYMPTCISAALAERGWLEVDPVEDWEGLRATTITDAGIAVTDLNCADWGIAPDLEEEPRA